MSRYFNSIARQAGIRFADQEGGSDSPATRPLKTARRHEPLEKDEVLLVPSNTITTSEKAESRDPEPPAKAVDTEPGHKKSSKNLAEENIPSTRPAVSEEAGQARQPDSSKTLKTREETDSTSRRDDPREKETIVRKDGDTRSTSKSRRKDPDGATAKNDDEVFFQKTLEIIEGRQAEPEEVRNIVIREVQEWVAAAPVEMAQDTEIVLGDNSSTQLEEPQSAITRHQNDPVISILDRSSKNQSRDETERPVEERFDLSIGTISVVIEGDEQHQEQNQLPPRPEQGQTTSTERTASSLLDRSYL